MPRRFKRNAVNALAEIAELQIHVDADENTPSRLTVSTDVRIAPGTESLRGRDFKYGPRRAILAFSVSGCEVPRGPRYNDAPPVPLEIEETLRETITKEKASSLNASVSMDASPEEAKGRFLAGGAAEAKAQTVKQIERKSAVKKLSKFVKSRPNLRWEFESRIAADPSSFLDDTYLADEPMFSTIISEGANQVSVEGLLYCRKSDFSIVATGKKMGDSFFQPRNREAIMSLVIQKAIKDACVNAGLLGEEYIVLSTCNVTDGD